MGTPGGKWNRDGGKVNASAMAILFDGSDGPPTIEQSLGSIAESLRGIRHELKLGRLSQ